MFASEFQLVVTFEGCPDSQPGPGKAAAAKPRRGVADVERPLWWV